MEKQILSDNEIESILQFNRNRKDGIRLVDLYHAWKKNSGYIKLKRAFCRSWTRYCS